MPLISKKLVEELKEKDFRDAYVRAQTNAKVVQQLRALRRQRGLTQSELAAEVGTSQSVIARIEGPEYEGWGVPTLLDIAAAHDVGLVVEFVTHEEFLRRTASLAPHALEVESFDPDRVEVLAQEPPQTMRAPTPMGTGLSYTHVVTGQTMSQIVTVIPALGGQPTPTNNAMNAGRQDDEREQPPPIQPSAAAALAALAGL